MKLNVFDVSVMLQDYLKTNKMTQSQFSQKFNIPQSTISHIKQGKTKGGKTVQRIKNIILFQPSLEYYKASVTYNDIESLLNENDNIITSHREEIKKSTKKPWWKKLLRK